MDINKFSADVANKLQNYVYAYVDEKGQIVYVGRGSTSNRAFSHLSERIDDGKSHNWRKLGRIDKNTSVYIVHSGMTLEQAQHCETTLINLCRFQKTGLTNIKDGDKFVHPVLNAQEIENIFSKDSVKLKKLFSTEDKVVVLAIKNRIYFKAQMLEDCFLERIQHEDGFILFTGFTDPSCSPEIKYKSNTPTTLCIIHDGVIRGIYKVESEIHPDYHTKSSAFAYITFEIDGLISKYEQYIGRKIERQIQNDYITESIDGKIYFLY